MATPNDVLTQAKHWADIHYKEGANNSNVFGVWYGMNNVPWCAIFVSYCFGKVGLSPLVAASTAKGFASCSAAVNWFKAKKQLVVPKAAQAGDIIFMNFTGTKSPDHVGLVISNDTKNKVLHTVEGNTVNPNGTGDQVNGDGVYYKTRPYGYVVTIARPSYPNK